MDYRTIMNAIWVVLYWKLCILMLVECDLVYARKCEFLPGMFGCILFSCLCTGLCKVLVRDRMKIS